MKLLNESETDRAIRMLGSIACLPAGWDLASGLLQIAVIIIAVMAFATGILGWCPAYTVLGWSTATTADRRV